MNSTANLSNKPSGNTNNTTPPPQKTEQDNQAFLADYNNKLSRVQNFYDNLKIENSDLNNLSKNKTQANLDILNNLINGINKAEANYATKEAENYFGQYLSSAKKQKIKVGDKLELHPSGNRRMKIYSVEGNLKSIQNGMFSDKEYKLEGIRIIGNGFYGQFSEGGKSGWFSLTNGYFQQPGGWGEQPVNKKYKTGGIVDYTGPAWVDGTPTKPEAFLSASDTENIAKLRDVLSNVFSPKANTSSDNIVQNSGDIYYEFHINVDGIDSEERIDETIEKIKKEIMDASRGRNVVNIKRGR